MVSWSYMKDTTRSIPSPTALPNAIRKCSACNNNSARATNKMAIKIAKTAIAAAEAVVVVVITDTANGNKGS